MASVAQIQANRLNAQKSTGPRTPEGKAAASQNAVKHGLLAEQVVIHGEDPAEFDAYRDRMLEELAPVGAVEAMLAERVVGLSWRLRRAERLQSAVFATVYRENADDIVLWPRHGLPIKPRPNEDEVVLGQVVMTDFARAQILDRLLVYERRIENSLYRTMAQLRRERESRAAAGPEGVARAEGGLPAGQESAAAARLASFGADVVAGVQTRETAFGSSEPLVGVAGDMGSPSPSLSGQALPMIHGQHAHATEQGQDALATRHGRDARATETAGGAAAEPSCETNPISGGV